HRIFYFAGRVNARFGPLAVAVEDDRRVFLARSLGGQLTLPAAAGLEENAITRPEVSRVHFGQSLPGAAGGRAAFGVTASPRIHVVSGRVRRRNQQEQATNRPPLSAHG